MDDIKNEFYQSIKEHRMNFYKKPTHGINLNENKGSNNTMEEIKDVNINFLKSKPRQKGYVTVAKGVCYCGKRGMLLWQKGYVTVAKGVCYCGNKFFEPA